MKYYGQELYHFGILGQKWGIRRYQNPDGSLTEEGKIRYGYKRKDVEEAFDASISSHKDAYDRIISNGKSISKFADSLGDEYEKAFNGIKSLNPQEKRKIYKALKENFGNGCDDEEFFDLIVEEYVNDAVFSRINKNETIVKKKEQFNKIQNDYWNDVHLIANEVIEKYGDAKIIDDKSMSQGKFVINDLIGKRLDTSFNAYISRHFDDYWVMDTDAYYNVIKRCSKDFQMDTFNKKLYDEGKLLYL